MLEGAAADSPYRFQRQLVCKASCNQTTPSTDVFLIPDETPFQPIADSIQKPVCQFVKQCNAKLLNMDGLSHSARCNIPSHAWIAVGCFSPFLDVLIWINGGIVLTNCELHGHVVLVELWLMICFPVFAAPSVFCCDVTGYENSGVLLCIQHCLRSMSCGSSGSSGSPAEGHRLSEPLVLCRVFYSYERWQASGSAD